MRFDDNYGADPNYVGSSLQPTKFYPEVTGTNPAALSLHTDHEKWAGVVSSYTSHVTEDDFIQPAALWEVIGREPGHQDRLVGNVAAHLKRVRSAELRKAVYGSYQVQSKVLSETTTDLNAGLFARVDQNLGMRVQQETEAAVTE